MGDFNRLYTESNGKEITFAIYVTGAGPTGVGGYIYKIRGNVTYTKSENKLEDIEATEPDAFPKDGEKNRIWYIYEGER